MGIELDGNDVYLVVQISGEGCARIDLDLSESFGPSCVSETHETTTAPTIYYGA